MRKFEIRKAPAPIDGAYDCAIMENGVVVAEAFGCVGQGQFQDSEKLATLLATAPQMLEALHEIALLITEAMNYPELARRKQALAGNVALRAIAKAEGEK